MRRRAVRFTLLIVLLASAAAAAYLLHDIERRSDSLFAGEDVVAARLAAIDLALSQIGMAQQSYVAPGQQAEPWFERVSELLQGVYDSTAAVRAEASSAEAAGALDAIVASTDALIAADTRARENLRLEQPLMAADVIFNDGRGAIESLSALVRGLRDAERASFRESHAALQRERWVVLGTAALVWLIGALILAVVPIRTPTREPVLAQEPVAAPAPPEPAPAVAPPSIDLAAVAALCTDLSRATTGDTLSKLLTRAASILDAPGIILWLGAGDELFPVAAHGYDAGLLARFGAQSRSGQSAAATAWRDGRLVTVAGASGASGAIVAPMFGPDVCTGVLAIEVRDGRERDRPTQETATLIAAQLATIVAAWPAPSTTASAAPDAAEHADASGREASRYH